MNNAFNSFVNLALNQFIKDNGDSITPTQQGYIDAIRSGDAEKGTELARNLCRSMGENEEQAYNKARQFFHI